MSRLTIVHTLLPTASRTATATNVSEKIPVGEYLEGSLHVVATAKAGTNPTLRPVWQQSHDGLAWADHTAMPTFSNATGVRVLPLTVIGQIGRVRCTVGGTGASVTYSAVSANLLYGFGQVNLQNASHHRTAVLGLLRGSGRSIVLRRVIWVNKGKGEGYVPDRQGVLGSCPRHGVGCCLSVSLRRRPRRPL